MPANVQMSAHDGGFALAEIKRELTENRPAKIERKVRVDTEGQ